jgi:hypothetical protein
MRHSTTVVLSTAIAMLAAYPALGQQYSARMRDGSVRTGGRIANRNSPKPITLDGRALLGDKVSTPVRTLRNRALTPAQPTDYLELCNGDVLLGRAARAVTGEAAFPLPDHLLVSEAPHTGSIRVRLDWVRCIFNAPSRRRDYTPNYLRLKDGREMQARSIRWTDSGVKVLTDAGVVTVNFAQIEEFHLPEAKPWLPPYPGAAWLADEAPAVVRTVTADGQIATYPRTMVNTNFEENRQRRKKKPLSDADLFATRPPWAFDSLLIDANNIAMQSFFEAGEAPLSMLPVIDVQQKPGLHHHPWRRNRNVYGGLLRCGEMVSELGVGMHANARLSFQLPPRATTFSTHVGLDSRMERGGCVHCRVWRDHPTGRPLWEAKFLTGADGLQHVGPLDVAGAERLILEVDMAHENRPTGADPFDIRDSVDWLLPMVHVEVDRRDPALLMEVLPEIAEWSVSPDQLEQIQIRPYWILRGDQWRTAVETGKEPLVLSQRVTVSLRNAWLPVRAVAEQRGDTRTISVRAGGEKAGSTMNGDLDTRDRRQFDARFYILHEQAGQTVDVEVVAEPAKRSKRELAGVAFDFLRLQPLVRNLPPGGRPIRPDVPLTSLTPLKAICRNKPIKLLPGKYTSGDDLKMRLWPFDRGYGVPTGSEITYRLDPAWRSFVAVIGLCDGWKGAGPYQILLDGEPHWNSAQSYARNDPGRQINVPIPPGRKTITLRLQGDDSGGAWACAGFLK